MEDRTKDVAQELEILQAEQSELIGRDLTEDVLVSLLRGKSVKEAFALHDDRFQQEYARAAEAWDRITQAEQEDSQFLRGFDEASEL